MARGYLSRVAEECIDVSGEVRVMLPAHNLVRLPPVRKAG